MSPIDHQEKDMAQPSSSRILEDRCRGASYRQLARVHGVSHTQARSLVERELDALALDVIVQLYAAWRDEREGKEPEFPGFAIPNTGLRLVQLTLFELVLDRLRKRRVPFKVDSTYLAPAADTPGGLVLRLELDLEGD